MNKIFIHKKEKSFWEETTGLGRPEQYPDHFKPYHPLGGGFIRWFDPDAMEETVKPTTRIPGFASIDGEGEEFPCTYNPISKWNGWHKPLFTTDVFNNIIKCFNMVEHSRNTDENNPDGILVHYYCATEKRPDDIEDCSTVYLYKDTAEFYGFCWVCKPNKRKEQLC